jgi:hypothetical protein
LSRLRRRSRCKVEEAAGGSAKRNARTDRGKLRTERLGFINQIVRPRAFNICLHPTPPFRNNFTACKECSINVSPYALIHILYTYIYLQFHVSVTVPVIKCGASNCPLTDRPFGHDSVSRRADVWPDTLKLPSAACVGCPCDAHDL